MDLYNEFFAIIEVLEQNDVTYAVIGGVALAFHDEPRFTRDIDILIPQHELDKVEKLMEELDFFKSTDPHRFLNVNLVLHRFVKTKKNDHLLVDILVGKQKEFSKIFDNVVVSKWKKGEVSIACRKDLIWLKRLRNSDQDKTDINKLTNGKDGNEN